MSDFYSFEHMNLKDILAMSLREKSDSLVVTSIMSKFDNPLHIYTATVQELKESTGMTINKAKQIKAILELGRRLIYADSSRRLTIKSPEDVKELLLPEMRFLDREVFKAVHLNTKHHVTFIETVSIGSLNASLVHPRELFKNAIRRSTGALIISHNHPSGDPNPSIEDIEITRRLAEAGQIIGIQILDHVIIGDNRYTSLKEQGVI